MLAFVEKYFRPVLIGAGVLLLGLAMLSAIREHDARILAEQTVKESAARVVTLEQTVKDTDAKGKAAIKALQKRAAEVKTPAAAITALPEVTEAPLAPKPLPDAPSAVQVEAVPLYQELSRCKQTGVQLGTCQDKLDLSAKIIAEKDEQIQALSKPKGFWKRFGTTMKDVGIGVAIVYGLHAATR